MKDLSLFQAMLLYHGQVDFICIAILFMIMIGFISVREKTTDQKQFFYYVLSCIAFAVADFFAFLFEGKVGRGIGAILYISNAAYFLMSTFTCMIWFYYIIGKTTSKGYLTKKKKWLIAIPFLAFILFTLTTFIHKQVFFIDKDHHYQRGTCVFIHWLIAGSYMGIVTVRTFVLLIRSKCRSERLELYPYLLVILFPLATAIIQIICQGTSLIQVGMMLSAVYVYLRRQNSYAYKDGLTGLNNRRRLNIYLEEKMLNLDASEKIFMIMMDVDFFKEINDTYGHPAGDQVLMMIGNILQNVSTRLNHIICARYGGDEFTIFGYGYDEEKVKELIEEIREATKHTFVTDKHIPVSMSVGYVFGQRARFEDLDALLDLADLEMYKIKSEIKR